ncbi:MAG: glycerol-3-phosphate 1-O-acyltransferase PlsY [Gammaproteobacteria bacterium]|nr:glycerol-3-phosphate 1-O-acyltransferase PlsY [Gammaproteobacteria bacterium]
MGSVFLALMVCIAAYLSGSVCSAVIVSRLFNLPDPRTTGSKNPGASNVLRLSGKKYAIMVLIGDMLKGLLPVLLAKVLGLSMLVEAMACWAAVMGHIYPVFFHFEGGKGVATAMGGLFGIHLMLGVAVLGTWLIVAKLTRYSSLASLISIGLSPFYLVAFSQGFDAFPPIFFIVLFVFYKHRENVSRLLAGEEPKLFEKKAG